MALEYVAPIMTCDGEEESVEHVWAKYNNTSGAIREHYFQELTLHQLFYPCPRLRGELRRVALQSGYKCYEKTQSDYGEWGNQQPPNLMLVAEVRYTETNFATSKMETKTAPLDRRLLYGWIKNYFKPEDRQQYEWFALWLLLKDKGLVNDNNLTLFAQQMVRWYPRQFPNQSDKEVKSLAKAIRIYHRLLGNDPDSWNSNDILTLIHDPKRCAGTSETGYEQIHKTFFNLRSQLKIKEIILKENT